MPARSLALAALLAVSGVPAAAQWMDLFNGKNLDGWESIGDGAWTVMRDGTLAGQRRLKGSLHQAWLYTRKDFEEFDLRLDYWTRLGGNSGVSIRDGSRARWAVGQEWDRNRTPSHIGYEIQVSNGYKDKYPTGSIYLFAQAREGVQIENDWNTLEIQSRRDVIRVRLNGQAVCEHPGDPERSKRGPIGLQLHDVNSVVLFRNIRIRELQRAPGPSR